ncbi:MAG: DUF2852 domain-containing protein [Hyphomicrobium sp.]
MPFPFKPPPPHVVTMVATSALAIAGAAYLMWRTRLVPGAVALGANVRDRFADWRQSRAEQNNDASRMFARAATRTGNTVFDSYREETLKKLESEAAEFRAYLQALRGASDRAEFESFLQERKQITDGSSSV